MKLSASEVSRLAGFKKPWMLNHLERENIFQRELPVDGGHGRHKEYTFRDLIILRAINRLLELGSRPKRISDAIHTFTKLARIPRSQDDLLEFATYSGSFVITQESIIYCSDRQEIIDLLNRGQLTFSFMVDIRSTFDPVVKTLADYEKHQGKGSALTRRNALARIATHHGL